MIVYDGLLMVILQLMIYIPYAYCSCPNTPGVLYTIIMKKELQNISDCSLYENSDGYQETQCAKLCKYHTRCSYFTQTDSERCGMCMVSGFDPIGTGLTVSAHTVGDVAMVYDTGRRFRKIFEVKATGTNWNGAKSNCEAEGGNLASLKSESDLEEVIGAIDIASNPCGAYWLSGCIDENSVWRWGDGDTGGVWPLSSNEPSNIEDFAVIINGELRDFNDGTQCFICESQYAIQL